jgi:glutathione S-transferase
MAILKLHGGSQTTSARRVGTVLHELKVPFEMIEVDAQKGEHKTAAYLQKQPFGLTPYIVRPLFLSISSRNLPPYCIF